MKQWAEPFSVVLPIFSFLCVRKYYQHMNDFFISLALLGAMSTSDGYLPYWMTTNQYGLMPERNGGLTLVQAGTQFDESKTLQWRWGASLAANAYDNPLDPGSSPVHPMVDQLYGSLRWSKFTLDLGTKHRENEFLGASRDLGSLSVTGGHLVESGNARSMPGYLVTLDPVAVPFTNKWFWIHGAYGDYATTDNRYVKGALVHRTRIGFRLTPTDRLSFDAILDHYGIWGGTYPDPEKEQVAVNLENYIRVVTGHSAGKDGTLSDQINVIGDQGGSEIFRATYHGDGWSICAQHDIPYNDGSGMGFLNFPDGVNTLCFSFEDKNRWVSDILYEHQYTMYQSGSTNGEAFDEDGNCLTPAGASTVGGDNYFWNAYYASCWTHYGHVIGNPLFLPKGVHAGEWSSCITNRGIENNRLKSHHLGIGGKLFRQYPYKLMLTYSDNHGNYHTPYAGESAWQKPWGTVKETGLKQLSAAFIGEVNFGRAAARASGSSDASAVSRAVRSSDGARAGRLTALYGLYLDRGQLYSDTFGLTLGVRYSIGR